MDGSMADRLAGMSWVESIWIRKANGWMDERQLLADG